MFTPTSFDDIKCLIFPSLLPMRFTSSTFLLSASLCHSCANTCHWGVDIHRSMNLFSLCILQLQKSNTTPVIVMLWGISFLFIFNSLLSTFYLQHLHIDSRTLFFERSVNTAALTLSAAPSKANGWLLGR